MITVSVIIPVFNAEKYLKECLNSLIAQTLTSCEFIFVNDGSVDSSQSIIENYQKKDQRIVLINQENNGVSVARNNGIAIASGEYLGFVDADDYIEFDFFEKMYVAAKHAHLDIVTSNFNVETAGVIYKNTPIFPIEIPFDSSYIQQNIIPYFILNDGLNTACNKLYKKQFINSKNILFPIGVAHGEDGFFNLKAFNQATKVLFLDYNGYFYREVKGSATRNIYAKNYFELALIKFNLNFKTDFDIQIHPLEIQKLKAVRLVNTVISLIGIYLQPQKEIKFSQRFQFVKKMIKHLTVQDNIHKYWSECLENKDKYQKFILLCIRYKLYFLIRTANSYSNFRNKK